MEYVNLQFNSFLILFLTGMILGVFFDLYRVFRSTIKVNKIIDTIGDLSFWVIALFLLGPSIYWSNWLELRLYVWLALATGTAFYFMIFSPKLIRVYRRFWGVITWLPRQITNLCQGIIYLKETLGLSLRAWGKKNPGRPKSPGK
ncbi:MAG: spore cortex biosynthesis protein YabQ [Firmicutes bacterium]|nr:spore cortex biosynthesis protein YabQ [Bacillota bacterium]